MTPEQYQKLKRLFAAAIEMEDARRATFLDEQCANDAELRTQIDALLRHHHPETVIEPGAQAPALPSHPVNVASAATGKTVPVAELHEDLVSGAQVAGRYRIISLLGRGGMGEVYRADDLTLRQVVALKFLSGGRASNPAWLARFREEVRIARTVTHPNVCRVYDIGEADGKVFISMEYIDGEDMASLLRRIGRLPQDKAVQVARQVCAGLGAAHDQGVLHRDLKPANIMLDGLGQARITDFGIAAAIPRPGERTSFAGTPGYIAPELLAGQPPSPCSDVYSLGLVLYEMVTGRRVFAADAFEQRSAEAPPPPPDRFVEGLDPVFQATIMRCLDEDPNRRPPSAYAVAAALPGGDPLAAALALGHTPSPDTVAGAWGERLRLPVVMAWFAAALVGLLAVVLLAERTFFLSDAGLDRNPAVLEDKAQEAIAAIGRTGPAADGEYRFLIEPMTHMPRPAGPPPAGTPGPAASQARVVFEFRQGERPVRPSGPLEMPAFFDSPWPVPGSLLLRLDPRGKLITYTAFPQPMVSRESPPQAPDWSVPFHLAGLRQEGFTPVAPARLPPMYADSVAAWEGPAAGLGGGQVRVEAAAIGSQVTCFHVAQPGEMTESAMASTWTSTAMRYGLFLFLLAGAAVLAWRHLRSGRSDRRGAWRLAVFMLCVQGLLWMVRSRHHGDFTLEAGLIVNALRSMVFTGVAIWIFYIGLEPQVRRFWPRSVISWNRVLLGCFRDPLVGRDLLVGVTAGIGIVLLRQLGVLLAQRFGLSTGWLVMPDADAELGSLVGFRYAVEVTGRALLQGIWMGLGLMLLMLLLRLALRNTWLAAVAFVVAGTVVVTLLSRSVQSLPWLTNGLILLVLTGVLSRVGLLAAIASLFVTVFLTSLPLTFEMRTWYAGLTGLAGGVLGVLLACGLYVALVPQSSRQATPSE